jgi:hypothetical protein
MRSTRRVCPQVLTLEGRSLMSGTAVAAPAVAAHVGRPVHGHPVLLNGRTTDLVVVDRKGLAHVTGSGRMSGLGRVEVTGTVNSKAETPLLASPWLLYADLEIVTRKGQINIHATPGTIGLNPFAQPVHMQYSIQGGTGPFRHATGKGLVDLTLDQAIPTTLAGLKQLGQQVDTKGVGFALHFHPGHLNQFGNFSGMWFGVIQTLTKHSDGHPAHAAHKKAE